MAHDLAQRIRQSRHDKGMTHEALAFTAGVSVSTVVRAESGTFDPSLKTLHALAAALDVPVADLLAPSEAAS